MCPRERALKFLLLLIIWSGYSLHGAIVEMFWRNYHVNWVCVCTSITPVNILSTIISATINDIYCVCGRARAYIERLVVVMQMFWLVLLLLSITLLFCYDLLQKPDTLWIGSFMETLLSDYTSWINCHMDCAF